MQGATLFCMHGTSLIIPFYVRVTLVIQALKNKSIVHLRLSFMAFYLTMYLHMSSVIYINS